MHVEQAFGLLVRRWGILWRPLAFSLSESITVLSVTMRLHNYVIDREGISRGDYFDRTGYTEAAFQAWWESATALCTEQSDNIAGQRRDLDVRAIRERLTDELEELGIFHPRTS